MPSRPQRNARLFYVEVRWPWTEPARPTHDGYANLLCKRGSPAQQHGSAHSAPVRRAPARPPIRGGHVAQKRRDGEASTQQLCVAHNARHRLTVHRVQAKKQCRSERLHVCRPAGAALDGIGCCRAAAAGAAAAAGSSGRRGRRGGCAAGQGQAAGQREDQRRHAGMRRHVGQVERQRVEGAVAATLGAVLPLAALRVAANCRQWRRGQLLVKQLLGSKPLLVKQIVGEQLSVKQLQLRPTGE